MKKLEIGDKVKILVNIIPQTQDCRTTKWFPDMAGTVCDSEYRFSDGSINDQLHTRIYIQSEIGDIQPKIWFYHKDLLRMRNLSLPEELFEWSG